jgi:hypothetical protein
VQIDHDDAESWSNMAAALLSLPPDETTIDFAEDTASNSDADADANHAVSSAKN